MTLIFPSDLNKNISSLIYFSSVKYTPDKMDGKAKAFNKEIQDGIVLPLPSNGLTNTVENSWEPQEGLAGGLLEGGVGRIAGKIKEQSGAIFQQAFKGDFIHDYAGLAYSGSNFRTFEFSWDNLIPQNEVEAINIVNICRTFERNSLPTLPKSSSDKIKIQYPNLWEIHFVIIGDDGGVFEPVPIRYAACTNVTYSNFTTNKSVFAAGYPVGTSLSLSFQELSKHSSDYVEDNI